MVSPKSDICFTLPSTETLPPTNFYEVSHILLVNLSQDSRKPVLKFRGFGLVSFSGFVGYRNSKQNESSINHPTSIL